MEKIVTNEGHDGTVAVEGVFAKHRARGESLRVSELLQDELDDVFLCRHTENDTMGQPRVLGMSVPYPRVLGMSVRFAPSGEMDEWFKSTVY